MYKQNFILTLIFASLTLISCTSEYCKENPDAFKCYHNKYGRDYIDNPPDKTLPYPIDKYYDYNFAKIIYINFEYNFLPNSNKFEFIFIGNNYCLGDNKQVNYTDFDFSEKLLNLSKSSENINIIRGKITTRVYGDKNKTNLIYNSDWVSIKSSDLETYHDNKHMWISNAMKVKIPFNKKPIYVEIIEQIDNKEILLFQNIYNGKTEHSFDLPSETGNICSTREKIPR